MIDTKESLSQLVSEALLGEKYPIAKIISKIETENNLEFRESLFQELILQNPDTKEGLTIGITGTPGAGKSSLLGEVCKLFLDLAPDKKMAIVAIDPSSNVSGGSILGDRTRVTLPRRDNRIYFRSQPSQLELGGLNPYTYHVIRFLRKVFDYVFIETVGIGQNEISVSLISDLSFLVMQPLGGDQVQFMKSGIMEVPEAFIINKCDEESLANSSYYMLESTLEFIKDILPDQSLPPIFKTSVTKRKGIEELLLYILKYQNRKDKNLETLTQLTQWIRNEYGRWGISIWEKLESSQWNQAVKRNPLGGIHKLKYEEEERKFVSLIQTKIK
ncbi:protein kinase [Leptospira bandrabouensis]|uniref:protein kinase n=1 Tax=Leptospira bandrabouensis TaxID=2484903 RepID=UPI001EE8E38C|nr:protein kinase [Leptospira bandrabouensis]MCG6146232.1 protein kinase [Leptospira bandrabouensis]MCG6161353.1 protein kinase [Leptospira bandrabouensis]MCG6165819.1 protein kinase [Leptospira bandrabouensis]MCW7457929.1 protein kinase [Leptospira bandrabouensis]MCW7479058.1 protein kinase [Leptospira bandrabouensis]